MTISKYKAFIKVVEYGSITKASKHLKYSQPGISHMIDSLESELGFSILKRNNGAFVPTENGRLILHYCEQIVKNEENLKKTAASINGLLTGSFSVGSYNSMLMDFVPNVVSEYSKIYTQIEISLLERDCDEIVTNLTNGYVDLAFMSEELVPKGFSFIPLFRDHVGLIVHKDHPFAKYDKIPISLLNGCSFIMHSSGSRDVIDAISKSEKFTPIVHHYTNSDTVSIKLVSNNIGVGILSGFQKKLLPDNVVFREFENNYRRTLGIAVKSREHATPAVKKFIGLAGEMAKENEYYFSPKPLNI